LNFLFSLTAHLQKSKIHLQTQAGNTSNSLQQKSPRQAAGFFIRAFSSEVETGLREENASKQ